jgi:hypothetical protein
MCTPVLATYVCAHELRVLHPYCLCLCTRSPFVVTLHTPRDVVFRCVAVLFVRWSRGYHGVLQHHCCKCCWGVLYSSASSAHGRPIVWWSPVTVSSFSLCFRTRDVALTVPPNQHLVHPIALEWKHRFNTVAVMRLTPYLPTADCRVSADCSVADLNGEASTRSQCLCSEQASDNDAGTLTLITSLHCLSTRTWWRL